MGAFVLPETALPQAVRSFDVQRQFPVHGDAIDAAPVDFCATESGGLVGKGELWHWQENSGRSYRCFRQFKHADRGFLVGHQRLEISSPQNASNGIYLQRARGNPEREGHGA